jgi:ABC-type transport system substrate-binding protein
LNFTITFDDAADQLISGKVDFLTTSAFDDIPETASNVSSIFKNKLSYDAIWMNIQGDDPEFFGGLGNFPVSQVWFRQAASHAINRTNMVGTGDHPFSTWFPDWIVNKFPDLDTTDYYNFNQGKEEAIALLDKAGYEPLGFWDEAANRFGWGEYANETERDGIEQTRGRHFQLISFENMKGRAEAIKHDLEQVGIFVDIQYHDWQTYCELLIWDGDPGSSYNTTDPTSFTGPIWDFAASGAQGLPYEVPNAFFPLPFTDWYNIGSGDASWWNENFEISRAKINGGKPSEGVLGIPDPPDMPPSGYPVPAWENDDPQYIEACEQAGFLMSKELPYVPLQNYCIAYALNNHVKNLTLNTASGFTLAYSYWSTEDNGEIESGEIESRTKTDTTTDSTDAYGIFIPLTVLSLLTIQFQSRKRKKI